MSGENVRTRQEVRALAGADWEQFIQRVIVAWTKGLLNEASPGSRTLRKLFAASREEAELSLNYGVRALIFLKQGNSQLPVRLPVLPLVLPGILMH
jgi:hypothetical protein